MNVKFGDKIKLKSLSRVVNESEVTDIFSSSITFKNSKYIIVKDMYQFFDHILTISNINDGWFEVDENKWIFSVEWIDEIVVKKRKDWTEPKEDENCCILTGSGKIDWGSYDAKDSHECYLRGNISCNREALISLSEQRRIEFQILKFMEDYNQADPKWEVYAYKDTVRTFLAYDSISTKWRFSTENLARECIDMIGPSRWKEYILNIKEENNGYQ